MPMNNNLNIQNAIGNIKYDGFWLQVMCLSNG